MKKVKYNEDREPIHEKTFVNEDILKIIEIGISEEDIYCKIPRHWHRSIEIILPLFHGVIVETKEEVYTVYPNEYLVINSGIIHNCKTEISDGKGYFGYAIQINYDILKEIVPNIENIHFVACETHKEVLDILKEIIQVQKSNNEYKKIKIIALSFSLIYALLSYQMSPEISFIESDKYHDFILKVCDYVEEHYMDNISVYDIADYFHVSYGYLAKLFKQYMDFSLKEYISFIRIKKVEQDLKNTDLSIYEIYTKHGFSNNKSFYREFKKYHTESPKEYRNK